MGMIMRDGIPYGGNSGSSSDTNVTQIQSSDNADYEVLLGGSADELTHTESAKKSNKLKVNPSTGDISMTGDIKLTGTGNTWDSTNTSLKNALGRYILQANVQATCYNTGMVEITVPSGVSADATGNFFNHVPIIQLRYNNAYNNYYVTSYCRQSENGKLILYIRQGSTGLSTNVTIYADILWVKIY